jgi:hypothetical protein
MYMSIRDEESRFSFDMQVSMDDMWDMDASVALAGNVVAEMMKGVAYQPRLGSMRVELTDRSLNGRVSEYCERRGLTAADTLRAQIESLQVFGESNGIGKSTLVITAQPSNPVAFSQIDLYKPSDVPALLNLAAVAH